MSDEQAQVGNVTIMAVQDTGLSGSPALMYPGVAAEAWQPWSHYLNPRGNVRLSIGTFVVRSAGKTVLVDTGLGERRRPGYPEGNLLANLRSAGVQPEDVDIVINTHLHLDHVGWNMVEREGGRVPTFPNARYLIVRDEWQFFSTNEAFNTADYMTECVLPLAESGQLDLVEGEAQVTPELRLVPAPGHTPAHACVAIVSGNERAMILGDLAHHPVQLTETAWEMAFDMDKALAVASRARIAERLEEERSLTIGGHFPAPGFGRLLRLDGRRTWQAL